jgi:hypothetical protein
MLGLGLMHHSHMILAEKVPIQVQYWMCMKKDKIGGFAATRHTAG